MIEEPMINPHVCASKENFLELLRRIRYYYHSEPNPHNKLTVTREQYRNYFKFAFVRNPWARAFSWYKNVTGDEKHRHGYHITGSISFREFLQQFAGQGMLRPQTYWITGFDGSVHLDYIGKFESLKNDFDEICRYLRLPTPVLPHMVKGTGDDYRQYYDKDSADLVSRVYRCDIETFGYTFES